MRIFCALMLLPVPHLNFLRREGKNRVCILLNPLPAAGNVLFRALFFSPQTPFVSDDLFFITTKILVFMSCTFQNRILLFWVGRLIIYTRFILFHSTITISKRERENRIILTNWFILMSLRGPRLENNNPNPQLP